MTSDTLPDYITQAIPKIVSGHDLPTPPDPGFGELLSAMWNALAIGSQELGKYPQRFHYRRRPIKEDPKAIVPRSQHNLVFAYVVEELADTLRYIQLTNVYRLQAIIEDITVAIKAGRLASLASPTRSLMETCAALKDARRETAPVFGKVLDLRARDFAKLEMFARRSSSSDGGEKAEQEVKETFFVLFEALAKARKFTATVKSDLLLKEWYGKELPPKLPKPKNVLTLIDKLTFSSSARLSARHYYEMLSEMTHPNMFAFLLFGVRDQKGADGVETLEIDARPKAPRPIYMVLAYVADPIIQSVVLALTDLREMDDEFMKISKLGGQLRHYLGK